MSSRLSPEDVAFYDGLHWPEGTPKSRAEGQKLADKMFSRVMAERGLAMPARIVVLGTITGRFNSKARHSAWPKTESVMQKPRKPTSKELEAERAGRKAEQKALEARNTLSVLTSQYQQQQALRGCADLAVETLSHMTYLIEEHEHYAMAAARLWVEMQERLPRDAIYSGGMAVNAAEDRSQWREKQIRPWD